MAHKLYSQLTTFYGSSAQLLADGYLLFYEVGTTTPKDVYGEYALSTNNGVRVDLDASGRPEVSIYGDGDYFVELFDGDDVKQGEDEVREPGGAALNIPIPSAGEYVSGDGSQFVLVDLSDSLLPDQTGHANDILGTDGTIASWVDRPADGTTPTVPITVTATSLLAGATGVDRYFEQRPTADESVAGGGGKTATDSVVFATAFKAGTTPDVFIELTGAGPTVGGAYPKHSITAVSNTGFTVTFSTLTGGTSADNFTGSNMTGTITYTYTAKGVVAG